VRQLSGAVVPGRGGREEGADEGGGGGGGGAAGTFRRAVRHRGSFISARHLLRFAASLLLAVSSLLAVLLLLAILWLLACTVVKSRGDSRTRLVKTNSNRAAWNLVITNRA